jgi:hypothetical protein
MHVDVALTPAHQCRVGAEVLWPLHGDRTIWVVSIVDADGLVARSGQSKDILIIPRGDFPVPVIMRKQQSFHQAYATGASSFNSHTFGGFYSGTSNA